MARGHRQEGNHHIKGLAAFLRPVLHLLGHSRQRALGAALDHGAHGVDGCGNYRRRRGCRCRHGCGWGRLQHSPQDAIGPVGSHALQAGVPGLQVQALEIVKWVVRRHIHRLGDGGVHIGLHRLHHGDMLARTHLQRRHEIRRQRLHVAAQRAVHAPGVVFHHILAAAAVAFALHAFVGPGERWLDAVGGVVGKGQTHRAGGCDGQQVAVANAVGADVLLQRGGQPAGEGAFGQVTLGVELGKSPLLLRQRHRGGVRGVAHTFGDAHRHGPAFGAVVAQFQHGQGVAHAGEAHTDAAFGGRLGLLLRQRPVGHVQHVVQCPHLGADGQCKGVKVEAGLPVETKRVAHKAGQDDRPQVAAAIGRQRLLATGVGGGDGFAVLQVVVAVDGIEEQDARLSEVVGRLHDGVPQVTRLDRLVHPLPVGALVGALGQQAHPRAGAVHQVPGLVGLHRLHEAVGHAHRHIEVVPAARRALGGDELQHIGVVDTQHTHLGATPRARALHGGARLVKHIDVAARAGRQRGRGLHVGALGPDAGEVVAHATAAPHGFGGFTQGFVDAGVTPIVHPLDAVAHRLHKAVDQGGLDVGACRTHDAPGADGPRAQVGQETRLVAGPVGLGLHRGQGTGHALVKRLHIGFAGFQVFFAQHVGADGLGGVQRFAGRRGGGEVHENSRGDRHAGPLETSAQACRPV